MNPIKLYIKKLLGVTPWQENKFLHERMINEYIKNNDIKKIQFGCGPNNLPGWLNTDINKAFDDVVYIDIDEKLPLPCNSFDYITSEHLIEHISFNQGFRFLKECLRILKKNGRIRITTPDLAKLLSIYTQKNGSEESKYIDHIINHFVPDAEFDYEVFVINNAFRNWGHQFLYNKSTMINLLTKVGFENIEELEPGVSDHSELNNIDVRNKSQWTQINKFEVMVFEASKA